MYLQHWASRFHHFYDIGPHFCILANLIGDLKVCFVSGIVTSKYSYGEKI
jgi:hypothetical protein